MLFVGPDKFQL